jgi:hypothetical protein
MAADVAIIGPQVRPQPSQINEPIDLAKQVIIGDAPLQTEAVEQRLLHHSPLAHHRPNLLRQAEGNQRTAPRSRSFSTQLAETGLSLQKPSMTASSKIAGIPRGRANGSRP